MTVSQVIKPPYEDLSTGSFTGFGDSISISSDGEMIASGETHNDDIKKDPRQNLCVYFERRSICLNTRNLQSQMMSKQNNLVRF